MGKPSKIIRQLTLFSSILGILCLLVLGFSLGRIENEADNLSISSTILAEVRPIKVYLPAGYRSEPSKQYPVVYTVDGERIRNSSLAVLSGQLVSKREFILVAIDMIGKRRRDLRREGAQAFGTGTSGKAEQFLDFIATELIPRVETSYRTSGERILAGHSYGGMFAVHTMTNRPDLFNGYLAFSPALNADIRSLPELEAFLQSSHAKGKSLFMNLGWETLHEYDRRFEEAVQLISTKKPESFRFKNNRYWLIHGAVPIPGYLEGLRFYFSQSRETIPTN